MTPSPPYRLIGRPESPYSMKVRAVLQYKGIDFEWLDRFADRKLFAAHAKVPLIPLLLRPDGQPMQDSTPILEYLEAHHGGPSLHPKCPAVRFLSVMLEELGDEWANKLMFYYRWTYAANQRRCGRSLAGGLIDGVGLGVLRPVLLPLATRLLIRRMVPRLALAGASADNGPILEASFANLIDLLDAHLTHRPYLFGGRPAFGDFGLWAQLHQAGLDPTGAQTLEQRGPRVLHWIQRMEAPQVEGDFEPLAALAPTLHPIFEREVAAHFLVWSAANAASWAAGRSQTAVEMGGRPFAQATFKYPARTLGALRDAFADASDSSPLVDFLDSTGCLPYLTKPDPR